MSRVTAFVLISSLVPFQALWLWARTIQVNLTLESSLLPLCPKDLQTEMDESNLVRGNGNGKKRHWLTIEMRRNIARYMDFKMIYCFFPGGRLISLNKTSLEGVTFSDAAAILQSSPDEVELIVSQPKRKICLMLSFLHAHSEKSMQSCKYPSIQPMRTDVLYPAWLFFYQSPWRKVRVPWVKVLSVWHWRGALAHRPHWVAVSTAQPWRNWRRPSVCPAWRPQNWARGSTFLLFGSTMPRLEPVSAWGQSW